jgi:hypothetical protein
MLGRWFFIAIVGVALVTYVSQSEKSNAASATITQSCSAAKPGTATVTFVWPGPQAGAQQTWFDISLVPGFAWGWFQGHGPLAPTQTAYAFDGLPNGVTFFYRVNTQYGTGWRETASGTFVAQCGGGRGGSAPVTGNVTQACDGGNGVSVTFNWQGNASGAQFIDLSLHNNGFPPGSFVGAGPVGGSSFTWHRLARGATHFWRVNTLTAGGWSSSDTGSFVTLACLPPLKACIGYVAGFAASGRAECEQLMTTPGALSSCLKYILKMAGGDKASCVSVKENGQAVDCLLGLSGQSYFGVTSCRLYYDGKGSSGIHG